MASSYDQWRLATPPYLERDYGPEADAAVDREREIESVTDDLPRDLCCDVDIRDDGDEIQLDIGLSIEVLKDDSVRQAVVAVLETLLANARGGAA